MMDYKEDKLMQHGYRVSRLQVVGVAAEEMLKEGYRHKKGICNVQWQDAGRTVTFYDVSVEGSRKRAVKVKLPREDAELALKVAQHR